jgi:hypothetical protein
LRGRAIVVCVTTETREAKEEQGMNHMDFDPQVIRERNGQMRSEIESLRLEERPKEALMGRIMLLVKVAAPMAAMLAIAGVAWT